MWRAKGDMQVQLRGGQKQVRDRRDTQMLPFLCWHAPTIQENIPEQSRAEQQSDLHLPMGLNALESSIPDTLIADVRCWAHS